ncbi:red chlorophyll catabolite reductase isoform X1 [Typha latifolia]|uniref:red chlorophyll catabolite reductase isoform X1 n=1 Tax=Typha latifolia TaxID=4733 RepID=UPI003C2AFDD8
MQFCRPPVLCSLPLPLPLLRRKRSTTFRASMGRSSTLSRFPRVAHHDLMLDLIATCESLLGPDLLPSSVPDNVLSFQSESCTSIGSLDVRYGSPGSSVDFILESWLHCQIPNGALDITTLFGFLNDSTDAPHFLLEIIQSSPTSLVLLLDLLPRRDLALSANYVDKFYQDTQVDRQRQQVEMLPQVLPYRSTSLYIRSILSPTAIAVHINCGEDEQGRMKEIIHTQLESAAKEVLQIWFDKCARSSEQMEETERSYILKRDGMTRKILETDLVDNMSRIFGADVANRVVGEIQKGYSFTKLQEDLAAKAKVRRPRENDNKGI